MEINPGYLEVTFYFYVFYILNHLQILIVYYIYKILLLYKYYIILLIYNYYV